MSINTAADLIDELEWRGLLHSMTEGADKVLKTEKITAYIGFDPTADSLHVGSLLQIMILTHLQRHGHTPIALVGGGTGMIGDPSGKSQERNLLDDAALRHNQEGIGAQLAAFLEFDGVDNPARLLNNIDWLGELTLIDFLRDIGKHFTINYMMAKDSVKSRLNSEVGISYTEFAYMLLQAYDFMDLYKNEDCSFQFGGSDQWGNITAGTELVRRVLEGKAHGVTVPLVMSSSGVKFGKTEQGAVWLDPVRTSPYRFYQFWLNTADADAIKYLKFFTLMTREQIAELEQALADAPHERTAQKRLAEEATRNVHGEEGLARAMQATAVLFGGSLDGLEVDELLDIFAEVPSVTISADELAAGLSIVELGLRAGVDSSKKRVRQLAKDGGVYLNNVKVTDEGMMLDASNAIEGRVIVLRKGKKKYHLVQVG